MRHVELWVATILIPSEIAESCIKVMCVYVCLYIILEPVRKFQVP